MRKRRDMRLDPTGVLWLDWKGDTGGPMEAAKKRIAYNYKRSAKLLL